MVELTTKYLERRRSQQQQQHFQTAMQEVQLPDVDECDASSAAAKGAVRVMFGAFGVAATAVENIPAKVGETNGERVLAIATAARAAAAEYLDSAPLLAAANAADKARTAEAITAAVLEQVVMASIPATTSSRKSKKASRKKAKASRKNMEADVRASAFAAAQSVVTSEAGRALVAAAMQTAVAPGPTAAAVVTMWGKSAGTAAEAEGLPEGLLEGRSQGHDSPCLKEQVEGLLWAGLFSINSACDLLQRLSCTVGSATAVGCGLDLGQRQRRHATADKVLLAAIRKAEEALAEQSQPPPSAAAAAAGGGMIAAAAAEDEKVQAAGGESAAGAGAGARAGTVAAAKAA